MARQEMELYSSDADINCCDPHVCKVLQVVKEQLEFGRVNKAGFLLSASLCYST